MFRSIARDEGKTMVFERRDHPEGPTIQQAFVRLAEDRVRIVELAIDAGGERLIGETTLTRDAR